MENLIFVKLEYREFDNFTLCNLHLSDGLQSFVLPLAHNLKDYVQKNLQRKDKVKIFIDLEKDADGNITSNYKTGYANLSVVDVKKV